MAPLTEPYPPCTRVHHKGGIYSLGKPHLGGHYWGVIVSVHSGPYPDGMYEYNVEAPGFNTDVVSETQWGSHHIDEALPPPGTDDASSTVETAADDAFSVLPE